MNCTIKRRSLSLGWKLHIDRTTTYLFARIHGNHTKTFNGGCDLCLTAVRSRHGYTIRLESYEWRWRGLVLIQSYLYDYQNMYNHDSIVQSYPKRTNEVGQWHMTPMNLRDCLSIIVLSADHSYNQEYIGFIVRSRTNHINRLVIHSRTTYRLIVRLNRNMYNWNRIVQSYPKRTNEVGQWHMTPMTLRFCLRLVVLSAGHLYDQENIGCIVRSRTSHINRLSYT